MTEIEIKVKDCPVKPISELKNFQGELKRITPEALAKLKKSITKNGFNAPIFVWAGHDFILDGHQRLLAINELITEGWTIKENSIPCVEITAQDKTQAAEMVLTYNSQYGEITTNGLTGFIEINKLELDQINNYANLDINLSKMEFDLNKEDNANGSLRRDYITPPFSILDTRSKEWLAHDQKWYSLMPNPEETREETLSDESENSRFIGTASLFNPTLAEILFTWFAPKNGKILNLYAGDIEPNIVAAQQKFQLTGIEIRKEQVEHTQAELKRLGLTANIICDDANNVLTHIEPNSQDLLFSCPPYYDLEHYSEDPKDLSNMDDQQFEIAIEQTISNALKTLKNNRFAVFVVGEVRNKQGKYRGFVPKIIKWVEQQGAHYYNEIILVNAVGSLPLRIRRSWESNRKIGKHHQNILVFWKGDLTRIGDIFGTHADSTTPSD